MQVLDCLTHSLAPAQGKVTVSCMLSVSLLLLRKVFACFWLPSVQCHFQVTWLTPACVFLLSSCVALGIDSLSFLWKALPDCIWGEQADSCLLPGCTFLYLRAEHAAYAINSKQMNQIVLQAARDNKIFLSELSATGSPS